MSVPARPVRCRSYPLLAAILILGGVSAATVARANDDDSGPVKPAARTAVEIGGASIVLVSANDKLLAFVDRLEDNAPLEDARLSITRADGSTLTLAQASGGLFVSPLDRAGRIRDTFTVALQSAYGTGVAGAEIVYDDVRTPAPVQTYSGIQEKIWIAIVGAALGATGASLLMFWGRSRRRVGAGAPTSIA